MTSKRLLGHCTSIKKRRWHDEISRIDGNRLGDIARLVDANQTVCKLEHVVSKADDDKLRVAGSLLWMGVRDGAKQREESV